MKGLVPLSQRLGQLLLAALTASCSAEPELEPRCAATGALRQELMNAAERETYLGLSPEAIRAIVLIEDAAEGSEASCTGTLIAADWVLAARHCLTMTTPRVWLPSDDEGGATATDVLDSRAHDTLDVALLRLSQAASESVQPLRVESSGADRAWLGERVELAGYGLTESNTVGQLRFLVEPIVEASDQELRVSGKGRSGACLGDSGGPLLARDSGGAPVVIGVLSGGSASCLHEDGFVRTAAVADWIEQNAGRPPGGRACGAVDEVGRCLFGSALWCEGGQLEGRACAADEICGWDGAQGAFRCVERESDPCAGAGSAGVCRGSSALSCRAGSLTRVTCDACAAGCRYASGTGEPYCDDLSGSVGEAHVAN